MRVYKFFIVHENLNKLASVSHLKENIQARIHLCMYVSTKRKDCGEGFFEMIYLY